MTAPKLPRLSRECLKMWDGFISTKGKRSCLKFRLKRLPHIYIYISWCITLKLLEAGHSPLAYWDNGLLRATETSEVFCKYIYDRSFWKFYRARHLFYLSGFSRQLWVIILKQEPIDAHFAKLQFIKFPNQLIKPSEHEIYSNREYF